MELRKNYLKGRAAKLGFLIWSDQSPCAIFAFEISSNQLFPAVLLLHVWLIPLIQTRQGKESVMHTKPHKCFYFVKRCATCISWKIHSTWSAVSGLWCSWCKLTEGCHGQTCLWMKVHYPAHPPCRAFTMCKYAFIMCKYVQYKSLAKMYSYNNCNLYWPAHHRHNAFTMCKYVCIRCKYVHYKVQICTVKIIANMYTVQ